MVADFDAVLFRTQHDGQDQANKPVHRAVSSPAQCAQCSTCDTYGAPSTFAVE
jgi:hypothetical protein